MVRVLPWNLITHRTQWMKMNYGYIFSRMNHTDNRIQPRPSSSRTEKINSRLEIRLLYTVKKMSWGVHKQPSVLFLNRDMVEWAHLVINLFNHTTVVWILVLPQNSYVGNLISGVIALWDGPSGGRWLLGDEGGDLMGGIGTPIKEAWEFFSCAFHHVGTQWEDDYVWTRKRALTRCQICQQEPWSWTFQTPEVWDMLFISHSGYGIFCYSSSKGLRQDH